MCECISLALFCIHSGGDEHKSLSLAGGVMVFIAVCLWTTVQQDRVRRETSCCYTSILYYRKHLSFFGFVYFV